MHARVRDLSLHPAAFIEAADSIECAARKMREINANALFVRDGERVGIITGMNLSKAVILKRMPIEASVAGETHYDVVSVAPDDFVAMALLKMTKHNKRRVAVIEDGAYVGILEDIDLLSFLAGNSQLVAARIDRAASVPELATAAGKIEGQTRMLRRQGVKIEVVGEIVSDLNRHLFAKLFAHDRVAGDPRQRLPHRHGQRGTRRADGPHRSGQRPDPFGARAGGRIAGFPPRFSGRWRASAFRPAPAM